MKIWNADFSSLQNMWAFPCAHYETVSNNFAEKSNNADDHHKCDEMKQESTLSYKE